MQCISTKWYGKYEFSNANAALAHLTVGDDIVNSCTEYGENARMVISCASVELSWVTATKETRNRLVIFFIGGIRAFLLATEF